jgi:hypothetical protein
MRRAATDATIAVLFTFIPPFRRYRRLYWRLSAAAAVIGGLIGIAMEIREHRANVSLAV